MADAVLEIAISDDEADRVHSVLVVRRLEFLKLKFFHSHALHGTFCIIVPKFVEIGHTVADILQNFLAMRFFLLKCKSSLFDDV